MNRSVVLQAALALLAGLVVVGLSTFALVPQAIALAAAGVALLALRPAPKPVPVPVRARRGRR
ncbi:hypothetical protein [Methylobacterium oryzisoli]|uniref:hypothetical protein n=1 Tax=Methylobacterium oryzisoli TaxID=3385502 RepID=UPI0038920D69